MMEAQDQALCHSADNYLHHEANFGIPAEVEMPLAGTECRPPAQEAVPVVPSLLPDSGTDTGEQPTMGVVGYIIHGASRSMLENGGRSDISDGVKNPSMSASTSTPLIEQVNTDNASGSQDTATVDKCSDNVTSLPRQDETISTFVSTSNDPLADTGTSVSTKIGYGIDFGESVALEDFGGEFEDGHGIEDGAFPSVDVFGSSENNVAPAGTEISAEAVSEKDSHVNATDAVESAEQRDVPECLDRILPKSPAIEGSAECEDEPPVLERELIDKAGGTLVQQDSEGNDDAEKPTSKSRLRRSRQLSDAGSATDNEQSVSNTELNVNTRPRRSVNRKSVFELLHVDYRYAGGPKKVLTTHRGDDAEVSNETVVKKQKSHKKAAKSSEQNASDNRNKPVKAKHVLPKNHDHIRDIDERIDFIKNKVVGYKPDDFLDDGDTEPESEKSKQDKQVKAATKSDKSVLMESVFSEADDNAARSFLSDFAAESDEALSSKQAAGDGTDLDALIAENQDLRSRVKALEQSKSLVKKFNIDFHGRKFSRIRSPVAAPSHLHRTTGKIFGNNGDTTPSTEHKAAVESSESILSRMAALDRREHKLRELSTELDERATVVKIAEGSLRRRERKLVDFEKTLEHRERLLSRHEQSVLKRELELGSQSSSAGDLQAETGSANQPSFAAEFHRRLEQRRLELDRRQTLIDSERSRLETRQRELDQREASRPATKSLASDMRPIVSDGDDSSADETHLNSSRPSRPAAAAGKQKRKSSVSRSIRSKYLSPKKQKMSTNRTPVSTQKNTPTSKSATRAYVLRSR